MLYGLTYSLSFSGGLKPSFATARTQSSAYSYGILFVHGFLHISKAKLLEDKTENGVAMYGREMEFDDD